MWFSISKLRRRQSLQAAAALLGIGAFSAIVVDNAVGASGNFIAVTNEQTGNSDARRSVTIFDADSPGNGPLFSVFVPFEQSSNFDEPDGITVDPSTGDIYVMSFDSGTAGEMIDDPFFFDAVGDRDLYKINFADVYDYWHANHEGKDVRTLPGIGGPVPNVVAGSQGKLGDYVTYGVTRPVLSFHSTHSNTFILPNAIEKVGEINRNPLYAGTLRKNPDTQDIISHSPLLGFFDEDTLLFLDDALDDTPQHDYYYRIVERVAETPGLAESDNTNGGYNQGTTESWESRRIGQVLLDSNGMDPPAQVGISNPQTIATYTDPLTGVRGAWIGERDGGGDDIAFYEIGINGNEIGYRPHQVGPGPNYPTAFALDNNPFVDSGANDGTIEKLFVDQDTGDLIIIEGSYADSPTTESGVIRREIETYDNGAGRIDFGAWHDKVVLQPAKDSTDTFLERGYWTAYDSVSDRVFFISPGEGNVAEPLKHFGADIYVLNVNQGCDGSAGGCDESVMGMYGETKSFLNVDESISLFFGTFNSNYADKFVYFSLQAPSVLIGDYNNDQKVDAADYTVWRDNFGAAGAVLGANRDPDNGNGVVTTADYNSWKEHFGEGLGGGGSTANVPEPLASSLLLVGAALAVVTNIRRRCVPFCSLKSCYAR